MSADTAAPDDLSDVFGQHRFGIRLDWGPTGAAKAKADIAVVVDVLSFSTSVTVAVSRGTTVFPYRWKDERAVQYATEQDAVLAVGRLEAAKIGSTAPTLSPAGLLTGEAVPRLVLPSPNGSTISAQLAATSRVVAGCLRNASAVARWIAAHRVAGESVAVIAAGERWAADDSLRPALEDQLGAGAILAGLADLGLANEMSPEASMAADVFDVARPRLGELMAGCVGGLELAAKGFAADVDVAADLDSDATVPVLSGPAFIAS